jgi:hypothetical protein
MRRPFLAGASLLAVVAWSSPDADAAPRIHDGFYMQLTTGLGYYNVSFDPDSSISGMTTPFGLMMGGTVMPGLAIGGGLFFDYSGSPTLEAGGAEGDLGTAQMLLGIGAHADYYLKPEGGLHFTGFLGWGGLEETEGAGGSDPTGLVIGVGGGYDWWIADEWSAGVLGKLDYAPLKFNDASFTTTAFSVLGTLTWH